MSLFKPLREYLPPGEYALFSEVRNATGFKGERSADAIAVGLWPSRGLEIIGYEFKISRGDWLRELKNPAKADKIAKYCDRWFIVAPKGIVKPDELPRSWGLLVQGEKGLRASVPAPLQESVQPLDRGFLAAILRRAQEEAQAPVEHLRAAIEHEAHLAYATRAAKEDDRRIQSLEVEIESLRQTIDRFEKASGLRIRSYDLPAMGAAIQTLLYKGPSAAVRLENDAQALENAATSNRHAAQQIRDFEALTKEVRPCPNPDVPVRTDDEPPGSTAPGGSCPDGAVRT